MHTKFRGLSKQFQALHSTVGSYKVEKLRHTLSFVDTICKFAQKNLLLISYRSHSVDLFSENSLFTCSSLTFSKGFCFCRIVHTVKLVTARESYAYPTFLMHDFHPGSLLS